MATIFQNKRIERNDTGNRMRFPSEANLTNLPFSCNSPGQFGSLTVTDEGGAQKMLTIENQRGQVCFTRGWNAFREEKGITVSRDLPLQR
ncbi:hypothetical protein SLEP1_g40871 [Rubroshorea leprosula]|uniref:TF-B3 domain-containing protein n=1 Tax=Rubroshorea leprosula TaxID=152421 RepID=A0AAV5L4W2_9ROSI|nr:hypothetical protein SLEP1_g40871 [Rubroshorea leprosula]